METDINLSYQNEKFNSLLIVNEGKPNASIVIADEPTASARLAVRELQYHIKKITGITLPVVTDDSMAEGTRILVGESEATRELGIDVNNFSSQEHMVDFLDDTLVLIGKDQPNENVNELRSDPKLESGKFGPAFNFDGVSSVITAPECGFLDEEGTLETWLYLSEETPEEDAFIMRTQRIPAMAQVTHWDSHSITQIAKSRKICYGVALSEDRKIKSEEKIVSNELETGWHHIVATHSASECKIELLIDGTSVGEAPYTMTNCKGSTLHIGGLVTMAFSKTYKIYKPFKGMMDGIRVSTVVHKQLDIANDKLPQNDIYTTFLLYGKEGMRDCSKQDNLLNLPGFFTEKGTLDAVYDFLELHCGVKWYLPGELGLVYSKKTTLEVTGDKLVRKPAMLYRWIYHVPLYMVSKAKETVSTIDEMLWKLRMRMGGEPYAANHSQKEYSGLYKDSHPEWFAQGYDVADPQFCLSNTELIDQLAKDAKKLFDNKIKGIPSSRDYYPLVPQDQGLYCKCENCKKWMKQEYIDALFKPMGELYKWEQSGGKVEGVDDVWTNGTMSEYVWNFINEVAKKLSKSYPDKYVASLAYYNYSHYPHSIKLEPNISVQMCFLSRNVFSPGMQKHHQEIFNEWISNERNRRFYLWLYYCHPALNSFNIFPGFFAHTVVKQLQMYNQAGIRGMFIEHSSEFKSSFLFDQIELYVAFKLADDPKLDGNKLIDEFFDLYYGKASEPMYRIYNEVEEVYSNPKYYPEEIQSGKGNYLQTEEIAWGMLGTDERMEMWRKLIKQAKEMAETQSEKQRVALFERAVWDYMVEGSKTYKSKKEINK